MRVQLGRWKDGICIMAKKMVTSKNGGMVAKATKGMGATSTGLFSKKGNKAYCPKISKIG